MADNTLLPANADTNTGASQRFADGGAVPPIIEIEEPEDNVIEYIVRLDNNHGNRGLAIIMTNDFMNGDEIPMVWNDGARLYNLFRNLQFEVIWHANIKAKNMTDILKAEIANTNEEYRMFVCCISTHGGDGFVSGQDRRKVQIKDIIESVVSLDHEEVVSKFREKPKLFFINACQGQGIQEATTRNADRRLFEVTQDWMKIAEHADVLLGFGTYQRDTAFANELGSYYIDQLVKYLNEYHNTLDIHVILAAVCRGVQSIVIQTDEDFNPPLESQLPMVLSTLQRKLIIGNNN